MANAMSCRLRGTRAQLEEMEELLKAGGTVRFLRTSERKLRDQQRKPEAEQEWFFDYALEAALIADRPRRITTARRDRP